MSFLPDLQIFKPLRRYAVHRLVVAKAADYSRTFLTSWFLDFLTSTRARSLKAARPSLRPYPIRVRQRFGRRQVQEVWLENDHCFGTIFFCCVLAEEGDKHQSRKACDGFHLGFCYQSCQHGPFSVHQPHLRFQFARGYNRYAIEARRAKKLEFGTDLQTHFFHAVHVRCDFQDQSEVLEIKLWRRQKPSP